MTISEFINNEVNPRMSETAFFFGNGLNNFCAKGSSWKELLIDLAEERLHGRYTYSEVLDDYSVSYPEFFDFLCLSNANTDEKIDYKYFKRFICERLKAWEPNNNHTTWLKIIMKLNRPILTTNYDCLLECSNKDFVQFIKSKQRNKKHFKPLISKNSNINKKFNHYYPWHSYYSDRIIKNSNSEFAIWHIHGFQEYKNSLRLGLSDYMGIVEKARYWMLKAKGNPVNDRESIDGWIGRNSWLDVFLHNNLLILGIDLGVQETSLRWLLIEREKYFRKHPNIRKRTWYIFNKEYDQVLKGRSILFSQLQIDIVDAKNSQEIYKSLPSFLRLN